MKPEKRTGETGATEHATLLHCSAYIRNSLKPHYQQTDDPGLECVTERALAQRPQSGPEDPEPNM